MQITAEIISPRNKVAQERTMSNNKDFMSNGCLFIYECLSALIAGNGFAVCFRPFWNPCLPKCLNKDTMLLCNCKAKIKKVSAAFAIACTSARLEQTVCYAAPFSFCGWFKHSFRVCIHSLELFYNRIIPLQILDLLMESK